MDYFQLAFALRGDRGVRFGIFHAKYAKGAKEIIFLETLVTLATVA